MQQKIWFITGISSGLGKAIATEVYKKGDFVIGTLRNQEQVDAFNNEYKDKALAIKLDVTNSNDIKNALSTIKKKFNRIDVLVNNAGYGFAGAIEETSEEEIKQIFETNFFSALQLTKTFLPLFREQKSGNIIQISSHGGVKAFAGFGIYNASKFALEGFSEALAQEVAPLGIKVSIIEPGPFRTNFAGVGFGLAATVIADYAETSGIFRQRIKGVNGIQEGDPDKAATAIYELVQNENPPLRLPLGKIALATITAKVESIQNDLARGRQIAESVVF